MWPRAVTVERRPRSRGPHSKVTCHPAMVAMVNLLYLRNVFQAYAKTIVDVFRCVFGA